MYICVYLANQIDEHSDNSCYSKAISIVATIIIHANASDIEASQYHPLNWTY